MISKNGVLVLSRKERSCIKVIIENAKANIIKTDNKSLPISSNGREVFFSSKETRKAEMGIDVLNFVLEMTKPIKEDIE